MNYHKVDRFFKEDQISNFIKILQVGAELFHVNGRTDGRTDGWTDMTKPIITVRNFATAPTNSVDIQGRTLQYGAQKHNRNKSRSTRSDKTETDSCEAGCSSIECICIGGEDHTCSDSHQVAVLSDPEIQKLLTACLKC